MIFIHDFLKKINTSSTVRGNIPLGLGMGLPMLDIKGERLLISVFYYRSVLKPDDKTLLMAPEYGMSFEYPTGKLTYFSDYRTDPKYSKVDFIRPVGIFRHDAVKHMNQREYRGCKEEILHLLDKLTAYLGEEGEFTEAEEARLSSLYTMIAEPSLKPFYRAMSPQFYQRFVK